jgi:hypothetical protein
MKPWIAAVADTRPVLRLDLCWPSEGERLSDAELAPLVRLSRPMPDGATGFSDAVSAARIEAGVNHYGPYVSLERGPTRVRFEFYGVWSDAQPELRASQRAFERLLAGEDPPRSFEAYSFDPDSHDASPVTEGTLAQLLAVLNAP